GGRLLPWRRMKTPNQSIKPKPHHEISSTCLPRHAAVAYLFFVRPMRAQSVIALLMITSVQLWSAHAHAAGSDAVGRAYTLQATAVVHRVVLASLVKHPARIHRMSMKCNFQPDSKGPPPNVKVASTTHNRGAEDTARRALAAAKFPPLPKTVIQQSVTDRASF